MKAILATALVTLGFSAILHPNTVDAAPLGRSTIGPGEVSGTPPIQVQHYRYDRHYHGDRYRYRRPGYSHFYGGYYYATPWWIGPSVYVAPRPFYVPPPPVYDDRSDHVDWCLDHYRSYDPRSDTYLGYDGYRHRCISPY